MVSAIHPRLLTSRRAPVWFRPAQVALSRGAFAALELADCRARFLVNRHIRADWGLLRGDDARENDWALTHSAPVHSLFELPTGAQLLVATDPARSLTCIVLADADPPLPADWIVLDAPRPDCTAPAPAGAVCQPAPAVPPPPPVRHEPASLADIFSPAVLDRISAPDNR